MDFRELSLCFKGYEQSVDREYNRMADLSIMGITANNRNARKKTVSRSDLFKPSDNVLKVKAGKKIDKSVWDGVENLKFKEYKVR